MAKHRGRQIKVNALRINQHPDVPLFVFGVNGRIINHFATVRYAHRVGNGSLEGYQREQVSRHIEEIRDYLTQSDAILPNAIVVSFDDQVSFCPMSGAVRSDWGTFGTLSIPLPTGNSKKPGFIVDGQQRTAALSEIAPNREFPVVVVAFQSPNTRLQREQFVLVNKTRPLPRDLLHELLPHVEAYLPSRMRPRQIAAGILEFLRFTASSPFFGRVKGLGASGEGCNISQAAIIGIVEKSMRQGVLSAYSGNTLADTDIESAANVVSFFFSAVREVWPDAWEGSPRTSRLVHGAGLYAMGTLMDTLMLDIDVDAGRALNKVRRRLGTIKDCCAWTSGRWPSLRCEWNELQNTSQDKRRLAEHLVKQFTSRNS